MNDFLSFVEHKRRYCEDCCNKAVLDFHGMNKKKDVGQIIKFYVLCYNYSLNVHV